MSKLHTTLNDLLFPKEGNRPFEPGQIVAHVEQHGIHYLDEFRAIRHSQKDGNQNIEDEVFQFLRRLAEFESYLDEYIGEDCPNELYCLADLCEHEKVQHLTGWMQRPKIKKNAVKSPINLNHAKARKSLEQIVRTLLIETGRLESIDGPIIDGKLKELVNAIAEQKFDDVRNIDTYSDTLKQIGVFTAQSSRK